MLQRHLTATDEAVNCIQLKAIADEVFHIQLVDSELQNSNNLFPFIYIVLEESCSLYFIIALGISLDLTSV